MQCVRKLLGGEGIGSGGGGGGGRRYVGEKLYSATKHNFNGLSPPHL